MIEINLLPESMRKAEATPLPRFIALCLGVLICGALLVVNLRMMKIAKEKDVELAKQQQLLSKTTAEAKRLDELEQKIAGIEEHVNVIRDLYEERTIWAKILYDLKGIVGFDPAMDEANEQKRYLWLSKLEQKDPKSDEAKVLTLEGYASSNEQATEAFSVVDALYKKMVAYQNKDKPEEAEKKRLKAAADKLAALISEEERAWKKNRRSNNALPAENPDLVAPKEELAGLEKKLKEIEDRKSGAVAITAFKDFFEKNQIRLTDSDWVTAPKGGEDLKEAEALPEKAHKFKFSLTFVKKEAEQPALAKRPGVRP